MPRRIALTVIPLLVVLLAACAPTATEAPSTEAEDAAAVEDAGPEACASSEIPVVAIFEFDNTTSQYGTTVTGVESAATARLITRMKASGCYTIVERSELQDLIAQQGLESLDPVALAEAAGAGYVVTGVVTRATIAKPTVSLLGVTLGSTTAQVEVDVRATDIITGEVVVSMTGAGDASNPNVAVNRIPTGRIAYDDPEVGPLLAEASNAAVDQVVGAIRTEF